MKKEKLSLSLPVSLVSSHCGSWVCAHCLSAPFCNSAPGSSKVLAWAGLGAPEPPSHLLTRRSEIITGVSSPHPQPKSTCFQPLLASHCPHLSLAGLGGRPRVPTGNTLFPDQDSAGQECFSTHRANHPTPTPPPPPSAPWQGSDRDRYGPKAVTRLVQRVEGTVSLLSPPRDSQKGDKDSRPGRALGPRFPWWPRGWQKTQDDSPHCAPSASLHHKPRLSTAVSI